MLNAMKPRCVRTIGVRLTEDEWNRVEQARDKDAHESISDVIRRLIAPVTTIEHPEREPVILLGDREPRSTVRPAAEPVSPTVRRFMATFQPVGDGAQRDSRARLMITALTTIGVQLGAQGNRKLDGALVKAVDVTHVAQCCQDVMEHPPRDPMRAWPMVLQRLVETYDETKAARLESSPTGDE